MFSLTSAALIAVMVLALAWDLKARRIPNAVTASGLAVALLLRAVPGGDELLAGLAGAALGLLVTLPLFALGGFGGGDSKLIVVAGAFLGPAGLGVALLGTGIVGGLIAVFVAVRRGVILPVLLNCKNMIVYAVTRGRSGELRTLATPGSITIPYGVAIAAGSLAAWFLPLAGWV